MEIHAGSTYKSNQLRQATPDKHWLQTMYVLKNTKQTSRTKIP